MKINCDVCGAENIVQSYLDWMCSKCGQQYEYEEGHRIKLSEKQLNLLRALLTSETTTPSKQEGS